jgi:6-phosphogluconate dehydrogenase (decarboxylating)
MEDDHLKPGLGFIGMGHMGSHMAQRLLDAGYQVTVYDRTREKAKALGQQGALVAQTAKDLAANCQVVLVCVTDDEAQHDVMFGPKGTLAGTRAILDNSNKPLWQAINISRKKRCKRSSASCVRRFPLEGLPPRECKTRSIRIDKKEIAPCNTQPNDPP